jgi:hypothetical protein
MSWAHSEPALFCVGRIESLNPILTQTPPQGHNLAFYHRLHSLWDVGHWRVPMQIVTRLDILRFLMLAASVLCVIAITFVI